MSEEKKIFTFDEVDFDSEEFKQAQTEFEERPIAWIQNDETPSCCGREMEYCGEMALDEDLLENPPEGAKLWWHDYTVFYIFTCTGCLGVKAIGQQM